MREVARDHAKLRQTARTCAKIALSMRRNRAKTAPSMREIARNYLLLLLLRLLLLLLLLLRLLLLLLLL